MGKVNIINRSLRLCGANIITSFDENTIEARVSKSAYNDILRLVLADGAWSFAIKWQKLAQLAIKPEFGYEFAYRLPEDALRIIDIRAGNDLSLPGAKYNLVRKDIYCNISVCNCRFIYFNDNENDFSEPFIEALAVRLASEIAPSLAKDATLALNLRKYYNEVLNMAILMDEQSSNPERTDEAKINSFLNSRL